MFIDFWISKVKFRWQHVIFHVFAFFLYWALRNASDSLIVEDPDPNVKFPTEYFD